MFTGVARVTQYLKTHSVNFSAPWPGHNGNAREHFKMNVNVCEP